MAFNVTSLAAYTKTNENMLITRSFFEPKTAARMQKLIGTKSTVQVPSLSDALIWQNGDACGFSASGDTTISARVLTVGRVKVNKEWCINDLETKYTQLLLSPGSNYDALPGGIDAAFVETILGKTKEDTEKAIWQGDTTAGDSQLNKFDGLVKIINAASGTVQANAAAFIGTAVTAITAANVISVMQAVYSAIPIEILDKADLRVNVGTHIFRLYQLALTNANLFNFIATDNALGEMKIHGTNVTVVSTPGLNNINAIYALRDANMFLGVDLEDEATNDFKFWYSEDFDLVRFKYRFKMGVQVSQVAEIVKFTL
jgi:hypothetical protein